MLGATGVVFGDVGTSPLYTMRVVFNGEHGLALTRFNVYGLLSIVFWALMVIVTLKYVRSSCGRTIVAKAASSP